MSICNAAAPEHGLVIGLCRMSHATACRGAAGYVLLGQGKAKPYRWSITAKGGL
jgi:hypothetical protein